jgi:hypothetical protein
MSNENSRFPFSPHAVRCTRNGESRRVHRGSPRAHGGQWKVKLLELVLLDRSRAWLGNRGSELLRGPRADKSRAVKTAAGALLHRELWKVDVREAPIT